VRGQLQRLHRETGEGPALQPQPNPQRGQRLLGLSSPILSFVKGVLIGLSIMGCIAGVFLVLAWQGSSERQKCVDAVRQLGYTNPVYTFDGNHCYGTTPQGEQVIVY